MTRSYRHYNTIALQLQFAILNEIRFHTVELSQGSLHSLHAQTITCSFYK